MSHELFCGLTYKRLTLLTIAIATLSLCFPSSGNAQTATAYPPTIWTIQIIGTAHPATALSQPTYKVTFDPLIGGCPYAHLVTLPDPENLKVCQTDTVNWVAVNSNGSKMTPSEMVIYQQEPILLNENDNPSHGFHASNGDPTGGPVTPHATLGSHKYYVIALDKAASQTYYDDQKIIIGTGNIEDLLKEIRSLSEAILAFLPEDSAAKKLVHDVDADVKEVKKSLNLK